MKSPGSPPSLHRLLSLLLPFSLAISSCSSIFSTPQATDQPPAPVVSPANQEQMAMITFTAKIPQALPEGQSLALEVLDEVTGLALNPLRYSMTTVDDSTYSIKLPFALNSVIKYRYVQEGKIPVYEYNSVGKQVRYRLYFVTNPAQIQDAILAWNNLPYDGPYGRVQGRVLSTDPNSPDTTRPVTGSLVTIGGQDTLTASDGSFLVDRLPPGVYQLVVYSPDGSHTVFQQEAEIAAESATPADVRVNLARFVEITFVVQPPEGSPTGIPIRVIGNIYQLGNTFADLRGGINGIASRAPLLTVRPDGKYEIKLSLPAGLDLRYKYTLGDGFWNAERSGQAGFRVRQLIVPDQAATVDDTITNWQTQGKAPITFRVIVPATTPPTDTISIQFNPYGWTEPIPMWPLGNNQWLYVLYSPLDLIGETTYRYCRNEQCGIADNIKTKGPDAAGNPFLATAEPIVFNDEVAEWNWAAGAVEPITVPSGDIAPKPGGFVTGVELSPDYHPSWQPYFGQAFTTIADYRANLAILSPTWHFTTANPPVVSIIPGVDASWYDLTGEVVQARSKNLQVAFHPTTSFYQPSASWWAEAKRDSNWWQSWFGRYETFVLNHADLARQLGVDVLILGDENISPALPGGKLFGGGSSDVPGYAEERWREIISKVRERYKGKIGWYLRYPDDYANIPAFIDQVDQVYVVMSGPLTDAEQPSDQDLAGAAQKIIGSDLLTLRDRFDLPVILGIGYPSAKGAASGCIRSSDSCLPPMVFTQGGLEIPAVETDARLQAQIYNAILDVVSKNEWVKGVFSTGFFPPVALADQSLSIRGKPASDVLWFWYDHFSPAGN